MSERAIGIDLGTSNSCVATSRDDGVAVLPNAYGERTSASVVHFGQDGTITVGNAAKANIIHEPDCTVSSAKRLIGRYHFSEEVKKAQAICAYEIVEGPNHGVRIQIREETFSLPEISAMVLREMKQIAEAQLGEPVSKAVITVPAYFNDNQRQATKDAGRIAGLEVLRILNEPTAAALAYGFGRGLDQRVAVYDLGGGTFDVSVLEIGKDIFEVLATCGDTFLGGDDFDDRIIDLLADEVTAQHGVNVRNDPYAFEKLKVAAENAKKGLSVDDEVQIHIPDIMQKEDGSSVTVERSLDTQEFASLIQDLIQRTFKVCDEALQQADITVRDLDGVILVGGPTRLPIIRQVVREYFQQEPKADVDPDEVVAMGAAIHAASLVSPEQNSMLLDVTPLDLRIGVAGGLAEPVIERNTPVPIEQTRRFTPAKDFQESVQIRVFQGDNRQADLNELLGQFEFSGFANGRRSDVSIDVTFEINADGIVNVSACDPVTGQKTSTTITLSSGLTDDELATILQENPAERVLTAGLDNEIVPEEAPAEELASPLAAAAAAATVAPLAEPGLDHSDAFLDEDADLEMPEGDLPEDDLLEEAMPLDALSLGAPVAEAPPVEAPMAEAASVEAPLAEDIEFESLLAETPAATPVVESAPALAAPESDTATATLEPSQADDLTDFEDIELEVSEDEIAEAAASDEVMSLEHVVDSSNAITAPELDGSPDDVLELCEVQTVAEADADASAEPAPAPEIVTPDEAQPLLLEETMEGAASELEIEFESEPETGTETDSAEDSGDLFDHSVGDLSADPEDPER